MANTTAKAVPKTVVIGAVKFDFLFWEGSPSRVQIKDTSLDYNVVASYNVVDNGGNVEIEETYNLFHPADQDELTEVVSSMVKDHLGIY